LTRVLRPSTCSFHESGACRALSRRVAGQGSLAPDAATYREPTQPASVGAGEQRSESSTRVRGLNARRVCPRVVFRLQKSASGTQTQRSASPVGNGACGRGSNSSESERTRESETVSRFGVAAAKPRHQGTPEPGAREGVAGQRFLLDGRHLGLLVQLASFTRSSCERSRRLSGVRASRERHDTRERGDRDVRGTDHTHRDGKTTPTAVTSPDV